MIPNPIVGRTSVQRKISAEFDWPAAIHRALRSHDIKQVSYVPDAGHKRLIDLCHSDKSMTAVPLTSEEEGIGLAAGAWLGGQRAAVLMQSSGVGNCVNALTLSANCGFPLLLLVTMRGEWGEFNPWQIPMGQTTPGVLQLGGVRTLRLGRREDAFGTVDSAARLAFDGYGAAAVLIAQRLIGAKSFGEKP
jgi:sulfopyruvate decarboxylase alpha subunit